MTGPKDKDAFRSEAPTDPGCRDDEATAKNTNPFLERTTDMSREELLDLTQYDPELEELFEQPASAPALPPPPVHRRNYSICPIWSKFRCQSRNHRSR
jgi:hypothetical protein